MPSRSALADMRRHQRIRLYVLARASLTLRARLTAQGDLGEKSGFATAIWAVFGLTVGFYALTIPLFFFGKRFRRWTNNSSLHRLDTA